MTDTDEDLAAHLSATTTDGQARAMALAAARHAGRDPAGIVTYQSAGRLLVIGSAAAIRDATAALAGHAGLSCTGLLLDDAGEAPVVTRR